MELNRRYRPQSFSEVRGNKNAVQSIENLLQTADRIPRAWLLAGPPGVGKTTLAHIIARSLNAKPGMGVYEQNAANYRKIEDIRQIIETMKVKPIGSPVVVYIMDEAHQLTVDSQNALLKPLEFPSQHVYVIFCTTEPTKLIQPLQDRCKIFDLKACEDQEIIDLVNDVAEKEEIDLLEGIQQEIAKGCNGSPRRALNLLEQTQHCLSLNQAKQAIESAVPGFAYGEEGRLAETIVNIIDRGENLITIWGELTKLLITEVYSKKAKIITIRSAMLNLYGRQMMKTPSIKIVNAIYLLEQTKDYMSYAAFTAVIYDIMNIIRKENKSSKAVKSAAEQSTKAPKNKTVIKSWGVRPGNVPR